MIKGRRKMSEILEGALEERIQQKKEIFRKEISEFQEIGHKFLKKEISSAEFKGASGGMGVYAQRSGQEFMIRLRILCGVVDLETLKLIQSFTKEYTLDFIHFTTRQAIQLHNLSFDNLIKIMERALENNLFSRGGGGNFPRNISLSPLSGVEKKEAFDVTPYAILVNKYFVSQMDTYKLPRKFKVAFSNNGQDTGNASIADIGFLAVKKDGKEYFKVYLGGSLGPEGDIAVPYDELINPEDIFYHLEAILDLFQEEGDYEHRTKARMRFIVKRMGREAFLECYKKHLKKVKENQKLDFVIDKDKYQVNIENTEDKLLEGPDVISQKQKGLYTIEVHPRGGILKTEDFNRMIKFLEKVPYAQIRLTMEEGMFIRNLTAKQAKELLDITKGIRKSTRLERSISCIGVPTCQIGAQTSQSLLTNILGYFREKNFTEDILPSIHISGCSNSCSRHQVNEIGFQGKRKRVNEEIQDAYSLHIGGKTTQEDTHLAKEYGDMLASSIPKFLYELAVILKERNLEFDEYRNSYQEEFESFLEKYLM